MTENNIALARLAGYKGGMMGTLAATDISRRLTNKYISDNYRDIEVWFMLSDFTGAFAYWVVSQSPYDAPDITKPLEAFSGYMSEYLDDRTPVKMGYNEVSEIISEDRFAEIPAILALNVPKVSSGEGYMNRYKSDGPKNPDFDFIDLGALARNVFYMLLRESITG